MPLKSEKRRPELVLVACRKVTAALVVDACTERSEAGLVVPMPILPLFLSIQNNGEDVPTANKALPWGEEDAMYRAPAMDEVAVVEVEMRLGKVVVA